MATPAAVLNILVRANTANANLGLAKVNAQARMTAARFGEVDKAGAKTSKSMAGLAKVGVGAAVGGLVVLGAAAKKAFGEFEESQKATAQTNAVLKSTGNVAKVTAAEIENLANQISLKSGIDDEAIQSGENLLLTFTKIRNETGKGNDIFNRATQVITDMSVALDQDLKSSAIQVGKALQDPQKGITALRRVGVNFNQTQSDMITKWVEHGHQLKAQKFILRELTKEFGGSAAAQATGAAKLRVAINNLFEAFGKTFGPALERWMARTATFINQMQTGRGAGGRFARQMREVGRVLEDVWPWIRRVGNAVKTYGQIVLGVNAGPLPKFIRLIIAIGNPISRAIMVIKLLIGEVRILARVFSTVWQAGRRLAGTVGDTLAPAFRTLKDVVNAALAPLRKAYGIFKDIRDIAGSVGGKLGSIGKSINPFGSGQALDEFFGQFAPFAPFTGKLGNKGAKSVDAFTPLAARYGLPMTSGYRPGDDGWHGVNRARDYSGDAGKMIQFAQFMAKTFGGKLLELIHTPLGFGIKNGSRVPLSFWGSSVNADHFDHVHVAMARGGTATRKVRALVGEEGPEIVDLPVGARVHSFSKSKQMARAAGGMLPGFASGGWVRAAHAGRAAGFKGNALEMLLAIGGAESGNYTSFVGDGGQSFSPWQIYHPAHPQYDTHRLLSDWTYAARAAYQISSGGRDWSPWTMFNNGGYRAYLGRAATVARQTAEKVKNKVSGKSKKHPPRVGRPHAGERMSGSAIRDAFMQAFEGQIAMREALAALTPDLADDIAVATDAVRGWQAWLDLAQKKKDQVGITSAATSLKQWRDTLADLTAAPAGVDTGEAERVGLLQTLLQQANLRYGVSQAQYGVLRNFPVAGSFATGGVIPGPLGSAQVAVVHGGETVTPAGAGGVQVIVNGDIINTPRGRKPVEVRDVRGSNRAPLPGRGGGGWR